MKECPSCGTENEDTATVCTACGSPLSGDEAGEEETED